MDLFLCDMGVRLFYGFQTGGTDLSREGIAPKRNNRKGIPSSIFLIYERFNKRPPAPQMALVASSLDVGTGKNLRSGWDFRVSAAHFLSSLVPEDDHPVEDVDHHGLRPVDVARQDAP